MAFLPLAMGRLRISASRGNRVVVVDDVAVGGLAGVVVPSEATTDAGSGFWEFFLA